MILAKVVSSPTFSAIISMKLSSTNVPEKTLSSKDLLAGIASPVTAASLMAAWPFTMVPSTGILPPGLINKRSPTETSSTETTVWTSPRRMMASCGAISTNDRNEERVFSNVRASRKSPNRNRKVTTEDSVYSRMKSAPMTAIVTNNSMLKAFIRSAR
ncbi:hypothetical protein SDC9_64407 [bioreactor metagenome]|uniref:Uncharacterized protein n=1 Tax=bioreactor metagenome TaxID=1076179 RepID=A0A644XP86_9ZZZZ